MKKLSLAFLLILSSCSIEVRPSPSTPYYADPYYRRYYYIPPPRYYYAQPIYIKPTPTPRPPRRGYYGPRK